MNKIEKEMIKDAIKEGRIYINRFHPIGNLDLYSPIKQINIPTKKELKTWI